MHRTIRTLARLGLPAIPALLVIPVATTSLVAQSAVPSGHDSTEGGAYSSLFGTYRDMRIQWADGEFAWRYVKGVAFRWDASHAGLNTSHGRKYKQVRILISGGDHSAMSTTFAKNVLSSPTKVFDASLQMPTAPRRANGPHPWVRALHLPFRTPWSYANHKDVLLDIELHGGTLDNRRTWTSTAYYYYALDAPAIGSVTYGYNAIYGDGALSPNRGGCRDSTARSTLGAYARLSLLHYGPTYRVSSLRNRTRASVYGYYYPPSHPVMTVFGAREHEKGTPFPGVSCNKVHIDLGTPITVLAGRSLNSSSTYTGCFNYFLGGSATTIPYNPAWIGFPMVVQNAWADKGNRAMRLSSAARMRYPRQAPTSVKRTTVYSRSLSTTVGVRSSSSYTFPVIRYDH